MAYVTSGYWQSGYVVGEEATVAAGSYGGGKKRKILPYKPKDLAQEQKQIDDAFKRIIDPQSFIEEVKEENAEQLAQDAIAKAKQQAEIAKQEELEFQRKYFAALAEDEDEVIALLLA